MLDTHHRDGWNRYGGQIELFESGERCGYGEPDENPAGTVLLVSSRTKRLYVQHRPLEPVEIAEERIDCHFRHPVTTKNTNFYHE